MSAYEGLDVEPSVAFAAELEGELLRRLDLTVPADDDDGSAAPRDVAISMPARRPAGGRSAAGRWAARALGAAALVGAVLTVAVIVDRRDSTSPERPPAIDDTVTPVTTGAAPVTTTATSTGPATTTDSSTTTPSTAAGTTSVPPTTVARPPHPPFGEMPAGTYAIDNFVQPFVITTGNTWIRAANVQRAFTLGRGFDVGFAVTWGVVPGDDPMSALGNLCPGAIEFDPPVITELFGAEAIQLDGHFTDTCVITIPANQPIERVGEPGDTIRAIAAMVDGTVVVVLAGSPDEAWAALAPEIDALVASMQLRAD